MRNIIIFIIFCLFSLQAYAAGKPAPLTVKFQNQSYELEFDKGVLVAKNSSGTIKGKREKEIGNYSQWTFYVTNETGFDVIIDQKNRQILSMKDSLEANGPFLIAASPDSKYVVFDYGTAPTARDFEVRTAQGKVIFKETYLNDIAWTKEGLEYAHPTELPLDQNKETKACREVGAAWEVQKYRFDGLSNKRLDVPAKVECSN